MLCLVGLCWCSSVKLGKDESKMVDLCMCSRVCAVESEWMSLESGKLKSPMMNV